MRSIHPQGKDLYTCYMMNIDYFHTANPLLSPNPVVVSGTFSRASHVALNRGVLITPFHNMALMAPTTTEAQVDRHTAVFADALYELID